MPRKKKYPGYEPEKIMKELLETVMELYLGGLSLRKIGDEMDLDWQKVRKLLCTASFRGLCSYESYEADKILGYYREKKAINEIMELTELSRSSVQSYLPYKKVPYNEPEMSANAERLRKFRERDKAVKELYKIQGQSQYYPEVLWKTILSFQDYPFHTINGLKFKYKISGGEMVVDRKEKTITKSTIKMAYKKALEMGGNVSGPKKLGTFGASYLYPIFVRIGVIQTGYE